MNLRDEILREQSKTHAQLVTAWIGNRQKRFDELVSFVLSDETLLARRAAWIMDHCLEDQPQLADPHLEKLVNALKKESTHHAVRRSITRSLETVTLPDDLLGMIYDVCIGLVADPDELVAARVYSMTTVYRICERHPELADELKLVIEENMPHGSPAFTSRGRKTLRDLEKLES